MSWYNWHIEEFGIDKGIYTYIYLYRERERERKRPTDNETVNLRWIALNFQSYWFWVKHIHQKTWYPETRRKRRDLCLWLFRQMPTWNASVRHLERSVPMLLSLSLCGLSMAGADVAGFMGDPDTELFVRWHQLGIWKLGTKMTWSPSCNG